MCSHLRSTILLIVILLVSGCKCGNDSNARPEVAITIDISQSFYLQDAIDSMYVNYRIIPISYSGNNELGAIDGIAITPSGYLLWDSHQRKMVVSVSKDGEFLTSIGKTGRGPGEYIQPDDVCVADSTIYVLDSFGHKILSYGLDGEFYSQLHVEPSIRKLEMSSDGNCFIALAGSNRSDSLSRKEVIALNLDGSVRRTLFPDKHSMNFTNGGMLSSFDGVVYYHKPLSGSIFSIEDIDSPELKYKLEFGSDGLPDGYEAECGGDYSKFVKRYAGTNRFSYFYGPFFKLSRYLIFQIINKGVVSLVVVDSEDGRTYVFDANVSSVALSGKDMSSLVIMALSSSMMSNGDCVYSVLDPFMSALFGEDCDSPAIVEIEFRK